MPKPKPAWGYDKARFHKHLRQVLKARDMTMATVKREIEHRRAYKTDLSPTTAPDTLASIYHGRRAASPKAVLELADAIGAPEAFPDYDVCQLRWRLDPTEVGEAEAARFAGEILKALGPTVCAAEGLAFAAAIQRGRDVGRSAGRRLAESPPASPGIRRGDGASETNG